MAKEEPTDAKSAMYQDLILVHATKPVGRGRLGPPARSCEEINRLCGDAVTLDYDVDAAGYVRLSFVSDGCALCRASASVLVEAGTGQGAAAFAELVVAFRQAFASDAEAPPLSLGTGPSALLDLKRFPTRERCVLLAWDAAFALTNHDKGPL